MLDDVQGHVELRANLRPMARGVLGHPRHAQSGGIHATLV